MSDFAQLSYVQARLQARYGNRLREEDWRVAEAARSVDQIIERVRGSALRGFTKRLDGRMSSHAIERTLRLAWRDYVAEAVHWVPKAWQPAVQWCAYLPDLPIAEALLKGETPQWAMQDADFASLVGWRPHMNLAESPFAPLLDGQGTELAGRWYAYWESLWPISSNSDSRALLDLVKIVKAHVVQLGDAAPQQTSDRYRQELAHSVVRMFRGHWASPVALFCHLILVALDLERLRGGLVRRQLFGADCAGGVG